MPKYTKHPCVEIINDQPRLKLFEYFYKELELPKYKKDTTTALHTDITLMMDSMSTNASSTNPTFGSSNDWKNDRYIRSITEKIKRNFFDKIIDLFIERTKDPVETTFEKIKNAKGELTEDISKMDEVITNLINRAAKNNQKALVDELLKKKQVLIGECVLVKNGYTEYVSEEKMLEFFLKCKKGVRIDFIRNYTGLIPFPVAEKKDELDKLMVFDNYCIAHYDPNMEVFKISEEDRAAQRRRDPILFGLIEGSRRLYYVADWVTDTDSLTLEELNLVVENATSRLKKWQDQLPTPDELFEHIQSIRPL